MRMLVGLVLGAAAAVVGWFACRDMFAAPLFARRNHRDVEVPVGAGVLLAVTAVAVEAVLVVVDTVRHADPGDARATTAVLIAVSGFAVLGLLDDVAATGDDRGFAGHLRALAHGRLTTGGLKLVGGGLLAFVVSGLTRSVGIGSLLIDAALIALAANLGNLFDRAPGRAIKVGLVATIPVLVAASAAERHQLTTVAIVLGAALGLLVFDLGEELMLGDAGSNVIGATAGLAVVLTCGLGVRAAVLVGVAALNVASERVSFSRVIDAVPPLRFLDRVGRRRSPRPPSPT